VEIEKKLDEGLKKGVDSVYLGTHASGNIKLIRISSITNDPLFTLIYCHDITEWRGRRSE